MPFIPFISRQRAVLEARAAASEAERAGQPVVITIARDFGAEGHEIGKMLSAELGIPLYDKEVLVRASQRAGESVDKIAQYDEQLAAEFTAFLPDRVDSRTLADKLFEQMTQVILDLGSTESCIIEGRLSDYILRHNPNHIAVLVTAPFDERVKIVAGKRGLNRQQGARLVKRMQRFGMILERMISPEGTFPVFGRSITYRTGTMQPLALLSWRKWLPEELTEGQVRAALTAVIRRMLGDGRNYNEGGYLTLGFNGSQPGISDWYTNHGSLYMASLAFLPLGLAADDSVWTAPAEDWTSKKAWEGKDFPKDHAFYE